MTVERLFNSASLCIRGLPDYFSGCHRCYCAIVLSNIVDTYPNGDLERVIPGGELQPWGGLEGLKSMLLNQGDQTA